LRDGAQVPDVAVVDAEDPQAGPLAVSALRHAYPDLKLLLQEEATTKEAEEKAANEAKEKAANEQRQKEVEAAVKKASATTAAVTTTTTTTSGAAPLYTPIGGVLGVSASAKPLTPAEKLARALKACKKLPKSKRAACEAKAKHAYAARRRKK